MNTIAYPTDGTLLIRAWCLPTSARQSSFVVRRLESIHVLLDGCTWMAAQHSRDGKYAAMYVAFRSWHPMEPIELELIEWESFRKVALQCGWIVPSRR